MSTVFLPKNRKSIYHRIQIPRQLRPYFEGRSELWRSLKTNDKDEARAKIAHWQSRAQRVFTAFRRHGDRMTQEEREALVDRWLNEALEEAEDYRALSGPFGDGSAEGGIALLSESLEEITEDLRRCDYANYVKEVDALLQSANLPALDHQSPDFLRLCRRFLQARQEFLQLECERWNGKYKPVQRPTALPTKMALASGPPKSNAPLFTVVVEKFIAETMQPKSCGIKPLRAEILKFLTVIKGDRPIDTITKEDARGYKDHLLAVRKLALMTVGKHVMSLQAIFKFALAQGYLPEGKSNPFTGLAPSKKIIRKTRLNIRDFSGSEMLTVFGAKDFLIQRTECPSRYWVCLMALFMGLRREEATQAAIANIHESEGIYYLQTAVDEKLQQNLKNEGSKRRVPVHSALIALGFLDYVAKIKKAAHVRLFLDLKKGGNGYGDAVGKWFGRHVTNVGLLDPALVFHSTRHTFITSLYAAKCPRETVQLLTGHSDGTVHEQYIHKETLPLKMLQDGLEKLRYEEVMKVLTLSMND